MLLLFKVPNTEIKKRSERQNAKKVPRHIHNVSFKIMSYDIYHREKDWENVQQKTLDGGTMFTFGYAILTFSIMKNYYFYNKTNKS